MSEIDRQGKCDIEGGHVNYEGARAEREGEIDRHPQSGTEGGHVNCEETHDEGGKDRYNEHDTDGQVHVASEEEVEDTDSALQIVRGGGAVASRIRASKKKLACMLVHICIHTPRTLTFTVFDPLLPFLLPLSIRSDKTCCWLSGFSIRCHSNAAHCNTLQHTTTQ